MLRCFLHPIGIPLGDFILLEIDGAICALCSPQQLPAYQNKLQQLLSEELRFSYTSTELLLEAERQLHEYFSGTLPQQTPLLSGNIQHPGKNLKSTTGKDLNIILTSFRECVILILPTMDKK